MTNGQSSAAQAGGFLVAASVLVGTLGGILLGQASAGFLVGLAVGIALALLLWWRDRRRF